MADQGRPRVSVGAAVARGRWTVKMPMNVVLCVVTLGLVLAAILDVRIRSSGVGVAILATALSFTVGWTASGLLWCVLIPRWRLWAYERVDDPEALEVEAIRANLIWPPRHPLGKFEFRPPALAAKLRPFEDYIWSRVLEASTDT